VTLDFALEEDFATVTATCVYAPKAGTSGSALVLDGRESFVELLEVAVDGAALSREAYTLTPNAEDTRMTVSPEHLGVSKGAAPFTVTVTTRFKPQDNLELSGLYKSGGNFCTQCEAEGFRLITYFPDRPDVMSTYEVRMTADLVRYPVLLSNGNLKEQFEFEVPDATDSTRSVKKHTAVWHDPHKKPCYLFALVAGDLAVVEDSFVTMSGRDVTLRIYAEKKNIDRCDFAMRSLIKAMRWDETRFGLEYDLDLFNIVAVDDFNMGAMENKSLNIFNSRLVLATPSSATDGAFGRIEGVIGHEYFHNWTGNRVTCRDWFQLSLKEGLTVFRDQEFSADVSSRAVKRIGDVRFLRDAQFAEDASPMAHPIRPSSYMKIDNFYTLTVYEKGAEVIRLYHTLLGERGFRKGMDLYFERHDGNAVTCDDFFAAMRDANEEVDIEALHNWYHQAGTPVVRCERKFDTVNGTYVLTFEQHLPTTPDERGSSASCAKRAQIVPVAVGLLDPDTGADLRMRDFDISVVDGSEVGKVGHGSRVSFTSNDDTNAASETVLLVLSATKASFAFAARPGGDPFAAGEPKPSLLRGFSAPVRLTVDPPFTTAESVFQFAHDPDPFNRWEAAQTMARGIACRAARSAASAVAVGTEKLPDGDRNAVGYDGENLDFVAFVTSDEAWPAFADACASILDDAAQNRVDRAWVEEALSFPATSTLVRELAPFNPIVAHRARLALATAFATRCAPALRRALAVCDAEAAAMHAAGEAYDISAEQVARRSLSAYCLQALAALDPDFSREFGWEPAESARAAYDGARNMTETVAALGAVSRGCCASDDNNASSDTTASSSSLMATTRHYAFGGFLETWKDDANVSCTYLGLVAGLSASASPGVAAAAAKSGEKNVALANVRAVSENHPASEFHGVYDAKVPNKFYALIGGFARGNVLGFHALDGRGYDFVVAKLLEMDAINAIAASRLAKPFTEWRLYDPRRASLMRACLEKILAAKPSPNMFEICTKSLAAE